MASEKLEKEEEDNFWAVAMLFICMEYDPGEAVDDEETFKRSSASTVLLSDVMLELYTEKLSGLERALAEVFRASNVVLKDYHSVSCF
jgi:hypothetical protein